jgi:ferredoxin
MNNMAKISRGLVGVTVIILAVVIIPLILYFMFFMPSNNSSSQKSTTSVTSINLSSNNSSSIQPIKCNSSIPCPSGEYCNASGLCLAGCPKNYILNGYLNQCQAPINVSVPIMENYITEYLKNNNITINMTNNAISFTNSYYYNETVKIASVNCQLNNSDLPCQIIFLFNKNGDVVNILRTT